jgi:hypothetical protein
MIDNRIEVPPTDRPPMSQVVRLDWQTQNQSVLGHSCSVSQSVVILIKVSKVAQSILMFDLEKIFYRLLDQRSSCSHLER